MEKQLRDIKGRKVQAWMNEKDEVRFFYNPRSNLTAYKYLLKILELNKGI